MAGAGGNVSDGEVHKPTSPAATTEVNNPYGGGTGTPPLVAASAGQVNLIPLPIEQSPLTLSDTIAGPTIASNPTTPLKSNVVDHGGATTTLPPTLPAPSDAILTESDIPSGSAASTPPRLSPVPLDLILPKPTDDENGNQSKTGESDVPSLVPAEETAAISALPSGGAVGSSTLTVNMPIADPDGVIRRPRSRRGRPQEPLTFGVNKQEAIHNLTQAPPTTPPPAATPPREGTFEEERTPPPTENKRVKHGKGIDSSSSSAGLDSPPPPSPIDAANSDSQVLRNRKDKDGNVRWYFSSAGATSSRKGSHLLLPPPPPPPLQPPVQGPQLPYPCSICGRGFYSLRSLCGHMKAHPGRQWRGAFPPPENLFPGLALPVDDGDEAGDDVIKSDDEVVDPEEEEMMRQALPEDIIDEQVQAAVVPPAGEGEEGAGGGKNPFDWDLNGPPPTESDEDMFGNDG